MLNNSYHNYQISYLEPKKKKKQLYYVKLSYKLYKLLTSYIKKIVRVCLLRLF